MGDQSVFERTAEGIGAGDDLDGGSGGGVGLCHGDGISRH